MTKNMHKLLKITFLVSLLASISACSLIPVRQLDIQQGTLISKEQLAKLHNGMTITEVTDLLGTPLTTDIFEKDQWTYIDSRRPGGKKIKSRLIDIYFKNGRVNHFETHVTSGPRSVHKPTSFF